MKLSASDLQQLRWPLVAAVAALIVSALLAWWSMQVQARQEQDLRQTEARTRAAENRLQQVRNEETEIRGKTILYLHLRQAGVIGPEQRLDWTELLASEQRHLRLPSLEYEFAPQAAVDAPANGDYGYYKSAMKLRLQLLHEEDLLRFISSLEQNARALVVTRNCKLNRLPTVSSDRPGVFAQLNADCEMDWITAHKTESK